MLFYKDMYLGFMLLCGFWGGLGCFGFFEIRLHCVAQQSSIYFAISLPRLLSTEIKSLHRHAWLVFEFSVHTYK